MLCNPSDIQTDSFFLVGYRPTICTNKAMIAYINDRRSIKSGGFNRIWGNSPGCYIFSHSLKHDQADKTRLMLNVQVKHLSCLIDSGSQKFTDKSSCYCCQISVGWINVAPSRCFFSLMVFYQEILMSQLLTWGKCWNFLMFQESWRNQIIISDILAVTGVQACCLLTYLKHCQFILASPSYGSCRTGNTRSR